MILGITGGFGCGKSTVLRFFESRNFLTLDADAVCHSFYDNRHPLLMQCIREHFGAQVFAVDGSVKRKELAAVLFDMPEKMKLITDVMYPLLTEHIINTVAVCRQKKKHGAFEIPLLYEIGFEKYFDAVLAVWCPDELRKKRLLNRNFTPAETARRDRMQLTPDFKLEKADFAVINNGSQADLTAQLEELSRQLGI